jgi:transcriptional regulator with XRE-family HTH domain
VCVNDEIRRTIRVELARRDIQQKDLAEMTGLSPQHVSDLLRGRSGNLGEGWEKVLNALGLRLIAVPKESEN